MMRTDANAMPIAFRAKKWAEGGLAVEPAAQPQGRSATGAEIENQRRGCQRTEHR
jgi:hypothetical protein